MYVFLRAYIMCVCVCVCVFVNVMCVYSTCVASVVIIIDRRSSLQKNLMIWLLKSRVVLSSTVNVSSPRTTSLTPSFSVTMTNKTLRRLRG